MNSLPSNPQDLDSLRSRMLAELQASHHVAYYQLISIIQGSVFAYLVASIVSDWKSFAVLHWILVGSTALLVVMIWNGYVRAITPIVYPPKLVDGLIPFLFGIAQCLLVFSTKDPKLWYWGLSALSVVGLLAYLNMEFHSRRDRSNNLVMPYILRTIRIHQG